MNFEHAEHDRQIANLIRFGTIEAVDHAAKTIKVRSGDAVTGWLPWPAEVGRNFIRWRPLTKGTQVILACQSGDLAQAAIVGMLYTQTLDAPSTDPDIDTIRWNDGAEISYHLVTGEMTISSRGDLRIRAGGDIHINAQNVRVFE